MTRVAVVDYGMGNLHSVAKALEHVAPKARVEVTADPAAIAAADRIVFPGQGAMPDCMRELQARGLRAPVLAAAASKPFLGICIGLQMLFERSDEGDTPGLGLFRGTVVRFPEAAMHTADGSRLKVPHMGWNRVHQALRHPLWGAIADDTRFYFVHSYFVLPEAAPAAPTMGPEVTAGATEYGVLFTCAVARNNIFAVQFHPEKSHAAGLQLLANFVTWNP